MGKGRPYNTRWRVRPGDLHVHALRGGGVLEKAKARVDPRISVEFRVDLEYPWGAGEWFRARSLDLSASGIYVGTERDLPLKAQLGCRIHLPATDADPDSLVQAQAIVVRINGPEQGTQERKYGLYFVELSESDAEIIRRFIFSSV